MLLTYSTETMSYEPCYLTWAWEKDYLSKAQTAESVKN